MKKSLSVFLISFIVLFLLLGVSNVSAYGSYGYIDLRQGSEQVIQWTVDFAEPLLIVLLGGYDYSGYLLFERFLVFLLIFSVAYLSLGRTPFFEGQPTILKTVTILFSLLAIRFIDYEWLNTILLSYGAVGIGLTAILPFVVYVYFLHNVSEASPTGRKIGWIFFIMVYYGLWSTAESALYGQVYFWTIFVALLFLLLDGSIHKYFVKQKIDWAAANNAVSKIAEIDQQITLINNSSAPAQYKDRAMKELLKARKKWEKQLAGF